MSKTLKIPTNMVIFKFKQSIMSNKLGNYTSTYQSNEYKPYSSTAANNYAPNSYSNPGANYSVGTSGAYNPSTAYAGVSNSQNLTSTAGGYQPGSYGSNYGKSEATDLYMPSTTPGQYTRSYKPAEINTSYTAAPYKYGGSQSATYQGNQN